MKSVHALKILALCEFGFFLGYFLSQQYVMAMMALCVLFFIAIVHYEMTHKYG